MEFRSLGQLQDATQSVTQDVARLGFALLFIFGIFIYTGFQTQGIEGGYILVAAAIIGGYMAMNIGANDVANNVGPAVGSKALTLFGALIIAAVFEGAGAIIAGGDVVGTIKKGIINPDFIADADTFIWLMTAALLAGALWLNLATYIGAPVSTTHSIVGGVLGAGIAAGGFAVADWGQMGAIAASWVISPMLGGLIAAVFLYFIKRAILYKEDRIGAAVRYVPLLIGIMAWAFISYLLLKGTKKIIKLDFGTALLIGGVAATIISGLLIPIIKKAGSKLENHRESVNRLFTIPLIFAAAMLSFAHGANDVANAIGPLAAINDAVINHGVVKSASIPLWVMVIGATGIAIGLLLYGPKLIRTVGNEITELDKTRAFCIALAAAITVIIASQLGLPVSSTHIAVGAVFGVGFLREYLKVSYASQLHQIVDNHAGIEREKLQKFLDNFQSATVEDMKLMLKEAKKNKEEVPLTKKERKRLKNVYKEELVKRASLKKIVAAWIITVPASAVLAAIIFFSIRGMML
ncbi:inorganic phosphate transporter [Hahella ganghwensis]|uniref:inorganic phosphate transporter n=1 Tax=Hahella ganghwensis TaxID=286420 RepID=UPI0003A5BC5C|nr:inorganic phosphate transporter [Hahella ganghwensis]